MSRRSVSIAAERTAFYLLVVLVGLLVSRRLIDIEAPLSATILAIVIGTLLLGAQLLRPTDERSWAPSRSWVTPREATIAVAGLVVVGMVLRLYALGRPSFWFDEAITTNAAIGLLETGRPTFPSGFTYWRGITHTLLVAGSLAVFGISEWAARFPSVLAGIATIPVTYLFGRELGNRRIGLTAAVLVTFLTWEIAWSRQARMYQLLQLAYGIALLGLSRVDRTGLRDPVTLGLIAGGILGAAVTNRIGLILFPVAVGYLAVHQVTSRDRIVRHDWLIVAGVVVGAIALELIGPGPIDAAQTVLATEVDHLNRYRHVTESTLGPIYFLGLAGLGLTYRHWKHGVLLSLALVPPLWILIFHTHLFAMRYLYFAVPILAVIIGVTIEFVIEQTETLAQWTAAASNDTGRRLRGANARLPTVLTATALPVVLAAVVMAPGLTIVPQAGYALGPNAPQPDFAAAHAYVTANNQPGDALVAGWTAPALYYHGHVDYWLAHDLTSANRRWTNDDNVEIYAGATPIENATELRAVIDCHQRGWLVIDDIVHQKLNDDERAILSNLTAHDVEANGMYVYSWRSTGPCDADPATSSALEPLERSGERTTTNRWLA